MEPWEVWVRSTWLSRLVIDQGWIWPTFEILHYFGLTLLICSVGLFDLRVLGMARSISPMALHRLIPWGVAGFAINLLTGVAFFSGFPEQYAYNQAAYFKLGFMAIAAVNLAVFYLTSFRSLQLLPSGADAPLSAKIFTGISLCSWLGVLVAGRFLTFFRPPFFH